MMCHVFKVIICCHTNSLCNDPIFSGDERVMSEIPVTAVVTYFNVSACLFVFLAGGNRKDKSLRIMSQKFVMLFLVSKTQTVTLDAAAKILIEESQDSSSHSKYKSKNVLQNMSCNSNPVSALSSTLNIILPLQLKCDDCTTSLMY